MTGIYPERAPEVVDGYCAAALSERHRQTLARLADARARGERWWDTPAQVERRHAAEMALGGAGGDGEWLP